MNAFEFGQSIKQALDAEKNPWPEARLGRAGQLRPVVSAEFEPNVELPRPPAPAQAENMPPLPAGRPQSWPAGGILTAGPFANPAYKHPQVAPVLQNSGWGPSRSKESPGNVPYPIRGAGRMGAVPALSPADVFSSMNAGGR